MDFHPAMFGGMPVFWNGGHAAFGGRGAGGGGGRMPHPGGVFLAAGGHPMMMMGGGTPPMMAPAFVSGAPLMQFHQGHLAGHHGLVMMGMHGGAAPHVVAVGGPMGMHPQVVAPREGYRHGVCGRVMHPRPDVRCDKCGGNAEDGVGCAPCNFDICAACMRMRRLNAAGGHPHPPIEDKPVSSGSSATHHYTAHGMMQAEGFPVQRETIDGVVWYRKTWPDHMVDMAKSGWRRCAQIGNVIPEFQHVDEKSIRVKGETLLPRFLKQNPSQEIRTQLLQSITVLQNALKAGGVAHCDVKPENAVVDATGTKVLLIDADFAVRFGSLRVACTPGVNAPVGGDRSLCSDKTDRMGFESLRKKISS